MSKKKTKKRTSPSKTPRSYDDRYRHRPMEFLLKDEVKFPDLNPKPVRRQPDLRPVEDLRHDREGRTFRLQSGRIARTVNRPQGKVHDSRLSAPVHTYFKDPGRTVVCVRRKTRRSVLFALQRAGKGKKTSSFHRFTDKSYMRCT